VNTLRKIFSAFTKRERLTFYVANGLLLVALIGLGAIIVNRTTTVVPARGGTYTEGVVGQPTYVNPILASTEVDKNLVRLLFASVPDLADKIEADATGRVWKIRLKENLRWSDNQKLTADDVVFTVQMIQDPETHSPLFASWQGVTVSRLSEIEVQFNLVAPYAFFDGNLKELYIAPKHLFADTPPANWHLSDYNLKPVASGPYLFDTYERQPSGVVSEFRMSINPTYVGPKPLIETFSFRFFPKMDDLIAAFNDGSVNGLADFNPESVEKISRPFQIWSFDVPSYYAVFLNQGQHLAFKDAAVREALNMAVDRAALVQDVFAGRATAVSDPVLPNVSSATGANIDAANQLLDQNGWQAGPDGIRAKTIKDTIIRLDFTLAVPRIPFVVKTAQMLADQWKKIGANVTVSAADPDTLADTTIKNRDYQAILFGNFLNPPSDLYAFWHSNERFYPGLNLALYNNKQADTLIESIRNELDPAARANDLTQLRALIVNDAPAVFLYSPNYLYITSRDLKGVETGVLSEPADRYRSVAEWHLKTTRALK